MRLNALFPFESVSLIRVKSINNDKSATVSHSPRCAFSPFFFLPVLMLIVQNTSTTQNLMRGYIIKKLKYMQVLLNLPEQRKNYPIYPSLRQIYNHSVTKGRGNQLLLP